MSIGTETGVLEKFDVAPSTGLDVATAQPNAFGNLDMFGGAVGLIGDGSIPAIVPFTSIVSGTDAARMTAAQFVDAVSGSNPAGASLIHDLHNGMRRAYVLTVLKFRHGGRE